MKYLILFLLVMFSCNVNADVSLLEYYLTLSEYEKQMYLNQCRLENYSKNISIHAKGDVCYVAYVDTTYKFLNEAEKESIFSTKAQVLQMELLLYLNKACKYYKLSNIKQKINMCKEIYKHHYENTLKCNTYIHTRAQCNLIKDNYLNY